MHRIIFFCLCLLGSVFWGSAQADAGIMITEILADPAAGLRGDANGDGVRSSTGDEFIEIWNSSSEDVDLTGWRLRDLVGERHVFDQTIGAFEFLVLFGNEATSGGLSLNNTGDVVTLLDDQNRLIDQVMYGPIANQDQSIVRQGSGWIIHTHVSEALFSPGEGSHQRTAAVPEPMSAITFTLGTLSAFASRRKQ